MHVGRLFASSQGIKSLTLRFFNPIIKQNQNSFLKWPSSSLFHSTSGQLWRCAQICLNSVGTLYVLLDMVWCEYFQRPLSSLSRSVSVIWGRYAHQHAMTTAESSSSEGLPASTSTSNPTLSAPSSTPSQNAKIQEQVKEVISDLAKKMHGRLHVAGCSCCSPAHWVTRTPDTWSHPQTSNVQPVALPMRWMSKRVRSQPSGRNPGRALGTKGQWLRWIGSSSGYFIKNSCEFMSWNAHWVTMDWWLPRCSMGHPNSGLLTIQLARCLEITFVSTHTMPVENSHSLSS